MRVKFQADADLHQPIVEGVRRREPSIDFKSSNEAELPGLADPTVLAKAASEGRVLVSHDFRTMPGHFFRFIAEARSPGVILISQDLSIGQAIEGLILVWSASDPEDWINRLEYFPLRV